MPASARYKLDLIIGLFLYEFFQESTRTGLLSLRAKGYLLTKAQVSRRGSIVLTSASNAVITRRAVLARADRHFSRSPGALRRPTAVALYGFYLVQLFAIVSGFSLAASVLFMRYRDLNQVWEVITQAGFFIAPIVYPLGILPERLHVLPVCVAADADHPVRAKRAPRMARASALAHGLLLVETCAILGAGMLVYTLRAPRVAEEL